jgi:hypothetical protein
MNLQTFSIPISKEANLFQSLLYFPTIQNWMTDTIKASVVTIPTLQQKATKRPRGRPPAGATLDPVTGKYILSQEAIEAAAERVIRHRTACRERYTATRKALRAVRPELFKHKEKKHINNHSLVESLTTEDGSFNNECSRSTTAL